MNSDSSTTASLDSELVARAQRGDADAFATLFHTHKPRVYSLCLRMTNNTAEAEDVTQEAFLQVFRKLATFRGDSALSTWLHRIAVNTVLMRFRKKSFSQLSLDEPCSGNTDAKPFRREYGTSDRRLAGSIDRIALIQAIRDCPKGTEPFFCCTRWRVMNTRRLPLSWGARRETRNHNCTRRKCGSGNC